MPAPFANTLYRNTDSLSAGRPSKSDDRKLCKYHHVNTIIYRNHSNIQKDFLHFLRPPGNSFWDRQKAAKPPAEGSKNLRQTQTIEVDRNPHPPEVFTGSYQPYRPFLPDRSALLYLYRPFLPDQAFYRPCTETFRPQLENTKITGAPSRRPLPRPCPQWARNGRLHCRLCQ